MKSSGKNSSSFPNQYFCTKSLDITLPCRRLLCLGLGEGRDAAAAYDSLKIYGSNNDISIVPIEKRYHKMPVIV